MDKNVFRSKYGTRQRKITLKGGEVFTIRSLNMTQKREIRESNMKIKFGIGKGAAAGSETTLDLEGLMIDTIIAACVDPSFDEHDREWFERDADSTFVQELYELIDTPVKLSDLNDETLGK